ncbi:hypothetical protein F66182_17682, partial [Fusarium sp. NRRL 66182]
LSNLIFEINEYVPRSSAGGLNGVASGLDVEIPTAINIGADSEDVAAAMYHIFDICDDDDTMDVIREPRRVPLQKLTASSPLGSKASAYAGMVKFTTPRKQRRDVAGTQRLAATTEQNAASGSTPPPPDRSTNNCHFLLDEFLARGDSRLLAKEEELADEIIGKFAEVIDVKDWGLFGSD